jgi:hypothetical protein
MGAVITKLSNTFYIKTVTYNLSVVFQETQRLQTIQERQLSTFIEM